MIDMVLIMFGPLWDWYDMSLNEEAHTAEE